MHRTRNGVFGAAQNKSGRARKAQASETMVLCIGPRRAVRHWPRSRSDMAQHDFSRTLPANRHEVTHATADHEPCRTTAMTQEAIRVEERAREQTVSILAGDQLAAMQVPRQHEVVAGDAGCLPDSRVMGA